MLDLINKTTKKGIESFGDIAVKKFYQELKNHKFVTTKCKNCNKIFFPPRLFCPNCYSEDVEWVELKGYGKIYAFTQQERAIRFMKPDVIGVVELIEDGEKIGRILTKINAKYDEISIGMDVKVSFIEISKELTLHQFTPIK
jgi:hypothetical protein